MLYPLQFTPRKKKTAWGVENWSVSGLAGDETVVSSGFLKGNSPGEITEVYMGELVGDGVYLRFGDEFPLLVKFIETTERLSVQVHPNDELAARRHNAYGKDEMWYILAAESGAEVALGLKEGITREIYERALETGAVSGLLNRIAVKPGDAFFVPAGTIHSIGAGVLLVEIQQPSDITYRIFDFDRGRELHTELASEAIDFDTPTRAISQHTPEGEAALLVEDEHFTVNLLNVDGVMERELSSRDSFTIYVCISGRIELKSAGGEVELKEREVVMVPADQNSVVIRGTGHLLEVYI